MISIAKYMDEYDIAQEIRLERKVHKGAFLLLEGDTDIKRFGIYVDRKACSIVNCYGRDNAVKTITLLYEEGFLGALGMVDADFDRILDVLDKHEGIIYSETHDFDLDWAGQSHVLEKYLLQVGDQDKIRRYGSVTEIIQILLDGLKPVSVTRLLNQTGKIRYRVSHIDVSSCMRGFSVDLEQYIALVMNSQRDEAGKRHLQSQIESLARENFDLYQITNGHDFHCALGSSLRSDLGCRREAHTWGREVEMHVRLSFSDSDFIRTCAYTHICEWQKDNFPYRVLDARFP